MRLTTVTDAWGLILVETPQDIKKFTSDSWNLTLTSRMEGRGPVTMSRANTHNLASHSIPTKGLLKK